MPILWRYALQSYLRVFSLSICTFIAVLIVARFKEIARFTALTGGFAQTGLFIVYHIPTILPIAIPISALISSLILFQNLSRSAELNALRSSGLSLYKIITPLLAASVVISLFNFSISAEIAPYCRRQGRMMVYHATSENPILLLRRQKLVKIKDAFLDMNVKNDEMTKDLTFIVPNESTKRLSLLSAKKLWLDGEELVGRNLAIVSFLDAEGFDTLAIENQSAMSTDAPLLSGVLKKNRPRLDLNALNLKMLRCSKKTKQSRIEILRRTSLSLAGFTFTFLGCAFGIEPGRNPNKKTLIFGMLLTLSVLMSYLMGKELKNFPTVAWFAFLAPHPFAWLCSMLHLSRISGGRT